MKKILIILLLMFILCSCKGREEVTEVNYTYDIISSNVDMSAYEGVSSTNHNFRLITVSELFNTIDQESSGIFYLGRANCGCCQRVCRYIDEVARELDVTVYYIDVYNENEPLTEKEVQDQLFEYLFEILGKDENGNKTLLTPHLFSVINGKFYKDEICFDNLQLDPDPTKEQVEKLKNVYREIMKPFSSKTDPV